MKWELNPNKYLTDDQIKHLFTTAENLAIVDKSKGRIKWQRVWILVHLLFSTGLRVSEARDLRHQDLTLTGSEPRLHITNGKCDKARFVPLGDPRLRNHIREYIKFKESISQPTAPESCLFQSRKSPKYSTMGLQYLFYEALREAGIQGHSVHHARHSFATTYLRKTRDLRGLQKLLGHSSVQTTCVYADSPFCDLVENTNNLYL